MPMEILNENDITITTTEDVHGKWMGEFQKLFSKFSHTVFDEHLFDCISSLKQEIENADSENDLDIPIH